MGAWCSKPPFPGCNNHRAVLTLERCVFEHGSAGLIYRSRGGAVKGPKESRSYGALPYLAGAGLRCTAPMQSVCLGVGPLGWGPVVFGPTPGQTIPFVLIPLQ